MKIHHLEREEVGNILVKVRDLVDSGQYPPDKMEEIFTLSKVDGNKFLECKNNPVQAQPTSRWTGTRASGFSIPSIFIRGGFTKTWTGGPCGRQTN